MILLAAAQAVAASPLLADQILGRSVAVTGGALLVDGRTVATDVPPVGDGENVFVPLRFLFEAVGGAVSYDPDHRRITIASADRRLRFQLGEKAFVANGQRFLLPVAPFSYAGRTMVPWQLAQRVVARPPQRSGVYGGALPQDAPASWSWPRMSLPQRLRHVLRDQRLAQENRLVAHGCLLLWFASALLYVWQSLFRRGSR